MKFLQQEAVQVNMDWKVPCTVYFRRREIAKYHDLTGKCTLASTVYNILQVIRNHHTIYFQESGFDKSKITLHMYESFTLGNQASSSSAY